jgi:putative transposase
MTFVLIPGAWLGGWCWRNVAACGRICFNRQKDQSSQVFAGQTVGIKQTDERIWLVSFMDYDFGYFDDETCRLEPLANPFGPKALPMSSV